MLKCRPADLSTYTSDFLRAKQNLVDRHAVKAEKYAESQRLFSQKNNIAFREVKQKLDDAGPTCGACTYCERDRRREIEHVLPQRHYPEKSFDWLNYILSCTYCNQNLKSDNFAVINTDDELIEFDRYTASIDEPTPLGRPALVNPRIDDPLDYFTLDFETGELVTTTNSPTSELKARFTLKLLRLNDDDFLRIRRSTYRSYLEYLRIYEGHRDNGRVLEARHVLDEINLLPHPTILLELQRAGIANLP